MADENTEKEGQAGAAGDAKADAGAPAAGKSGSKMGMFVVIIIGFLVMILTPVITVIVVKMQLPPPIESEIATVENKGVETVLELGDSILVNIAETKGTRVLRLKTHLVLSEARLQPELSNMTPMLKDRVMLAASRRTIDELDGVQGREALKRDIMGEINAVIKDKMNGAIIDVYFSEFLIQ